MLSPPGARGRGGATHRLSRARRTGQASTLVTEGNELGERLCTVVGTKPIWGSPPRGVGPPKGPQQRAWRRELAMLVASAQAHDRAKTAASEVSPAPPRRERLADQGLEAASARAGWGPAVTGAARVLLPQIGEREAEQLCPALSSWAVGHLPSSHPDEVRLWKEECVPGFCPIEPKVKPSGGGRALLVLFMHGFGGAGPWEDTVLGPQGLKDGCSLLTPGYWPHWEPGGAGAGERAAQSFGTRLWAATGLLGGPSPTAEACSHGEATSPRGASASTLGPVLGASSKSSLCPVLAPETDSPGGRNISEDPCQKAFISAAHPSSPARGPSSSPGGLGQEGGGLGQAPGRPNRRQLENPAWLRVSFGTPHLGHKTRTSRRFSSIGTTALSAVGPGRPVQGPGQYSSRPVGHLPVAEEGKSSTLVEGQKSEDLTPAFLQAHLVGRSSKLLDLFKRP
ncbi:uncharacterized protein LOC122917018 [Neovison vison]|uniref:uncharacterized protein LOC122917018 n=1 Tax=Neovison vison TaxID=452646 RepID=UPI001CF09F72|nr:uncharacterized protein LOC122917018 [Neogale vison]